MKRNDRPLAAHPYKSYRYPNRYGGWIHAGAMTTEEALKEVRRSTNTTVESAHLQVWDGTAWLPAQLESTE